MSSTTTFPTPTITDTDTSSSPSTSRPSIFYAFMISILLGLALAMYSSFIVILFTRTWRRMGGDLVRLQPWLQGDRGGRMKLVSPRLWETWLSPLTPEKAGGASQFDWQRIQPISASFICAYHSQAESAPAVGISGPAAPADTPTFPLVGNSQPSSTDLLDRSISRSLSISKEEEEIKNSPGAMKISVIICMPYPTYRNDGTRLSCDSGRPGDAPREYQIGVAQVPWTWGPV